MIRRAQVLFMGIIAIATGAPSTAQAASTVSGGVDLRALHSTAPSGTEAEFAGAFLNLRQVWADTSGDRWIGVAQLDFDRNFEDVHPYQAYLRYKGPLGKWNILAGHFLLPFGLLANYDTERLLLQGIETTNLGIRTDTGAQLFGRSGDWDYAVSLTDGLSNSRLFDDDARPVLTTRVAYVKEVWQVGFSALAGRVWSRFEPLTGEANDSGAVARERRFALDALRVWGPLTLRAEASAGTNNGERVWGGVLLADYAIAPKLELNFRYAIWRPLFTNQTVGAGLTYEVGHGFFVRIADNYELTGMKNNALTTQLYFEFSHRI